MSTPLCTVFDTAIGSCAIAWRGAAICGVHLPEDDGSRLWGRMQRQLPGLTPAAPPDWVRAIVARVQALLTGSRDSLLDVPLDMADVPDFHQRVYAATRAIAPGRTLTYGALAVQLGQPGAARAVGQALGRNPFAPIVPCHRVLAAGGAAGGFSAAGGARTKLRLLRIEGARFDDQPGLFDAAD